jgi:hypothetical protein
MNQHRQRAKQANYIDMYHNRLNGKHIDQSNAQDEGEAGDVEINYDRGYVPPAKQPPRHGKNDDRSDDKLPRRVRQEPKFHEERNNKPAVDTKQNGKMKKFKNLDDIPDYDSGDGVLESPKRQVNLTKPQKNEIGRNSITVSELVLHYFNLFLL